MLTIPLHVLTVSCSMKNAFSSDGIELHPHAVYERELQFGQLGRMLCFQRRNVHLGSDLFSKSPSIIHTCAIF